MSTCCPTEVNVSIGMKVLLRYVDLLCLTSFTIVKSCPRDCSLQLFDVESALFTMFQGLVSRTFVVTQGFN
jgi:hypothetical protein